MQPLNDRGILAGVRLRYQNMTHLLYLPPHTSHVLQPLDYVHLLTSQALLSQAGRIAQSVDLSIKTVTSAETEALRHFAEDGEHRLGNGATVRVLTYGVVAHGIRTSSMDVDHFDELQDGILKAISRSSPTSATVSRSRSSPGGGSLSISSRSFT